MDTKSNNLGHLDLCGETIQVNVYRRRSGLEAVSVILKSWCEELSILFRNNQVNVDKVSVSVAEEAKEYAVCNTNSPWL